MAPQSSIPVAATVLGTIGTILWCVQLVPQIWTNWRTKSTDGLPGSMMFLWAICGVPFGAYSIIQNFNVPIQVQPQCFMGLCLVSWAQVLVYGRRWRAWTAALLGVAVAAACAGIEAALILTLRVSAVLMSFFCYEIETKLQSVKIYECSYICCGAPLCVFSLARKLLLTMEPANLPGR